MKWERKSETCAVAFFTMVTTSAYSAREVRIPSAVRVIREATGWRVDRCSAVAGAWLPWEPIEDAGSHPDSTAYPTITAAKAAGRAYVARNSRVSRDLASCEPGVPGAAKAS